PALYRYFGSHEELLRHVVGDIFTDLADYVQAAIHAAADEAEPGTSPDDVLAAKLIAGCRAFRAWTLGHVPEFSMIFGSPLPGLEAFHQMTLGDVGRGHTGEPNIDCGYKFGQLFLNLFGELYRRRPFPIPADEEIQPSLRKQLARYQQVVGSDLPLGALQTFLRCWVLLYGTVSL
ncbi:MAG: WHG domain-containing protein, partial [Actinobacteria bacterium]|nr:WHG domain-containing protein [Actinomycetota bacterium]